MGPAGTILGSIFAIVVAIGAFVFGLIVLLAAVALGLLAWLGFAIRRWWLGRKTVSGDAEGRGQGAEKRQSTAEVIEAEYTVISRRRE